MFCFDSSHSDHKGWAFAQPFFVNCPRFNRGLLVNKRIALTISEDDPKIKENVQLKRKCVMKVTSYSKSGVPDREGRDNSLFRMIVTAAVHLGISLQLVLCGVLTGSKQLFHRLFDIAPAVRIDLRGGFDDRREGVPFVF